MEHKTIVNMLAALAQESRLSLFRLLVQAGPQGMAAGAIGGALGVPGSTLSFHLKELSQAGLIVARNESRYVYYSANFEAMTSLLGYMTENCCGNGQQASCCDISTKEIT